MSSISLITIGTELLKGRIVNTNAAKAGEILQANGYSLDRVVTIGDTSTAIRENLSKEIQMSDIVLISGGLGPTKDDITKQTLAAYFKTELKWHEPTLAFLEDRYRDRPGTLTELTRRQALVPASCKVIANTMGTAPGMCFALADKLIISMPGVPYEMLTMLELGVLPLIRESFPAGIRLNRVIRLADIPESVAAERMEKIEASLAPEISLAYLPRADGLWLELSVRVPENKRNEAEEALAEAHKSVYQLFKDKAYAMGDTPLPKILGDLLREKKLTIAVAESLTGGALAASIVSISGSSDYFLGSVTAYASRIKTELLKVPADLIDQKGVVSADVANEMASGVRDLLKADIGLSTTGLAEADGDIRPHAYLGYADKSGNLARHVHFYYNRNVNIDRATNYCLQWGLKKVKERF